MTSSSGMALFTRRVSDLLARPLVAVAPETAVVEVARRLSRERVGSVVVTHDDVPAGIITDQDLRQRVVEAGRDPARTPASTIMSFPVLTLAPSARAFDALLVMTRHRVRHVVVVENGRAIGVISNRDLLDLHAVHPVMLADDIARAPSVEALGRLAPAVVDLIRRLFADGGKVLEIAQLVSELNDRIVIRVIELTTQALADDGRRAPVPFAWLAFGSEGRREQTLHTDQDNGVVYADPPAELDDAAREYFARLAQRVVDALIVIGIPECPGGAMASNRRWCQPLGVWKRYVDDWISAPSPEHLLAAAMYFDLRPVSGNFRLAAALADRIHAEAPAHPRFLGLMARDVVDRRVPLTLFGNVGVARSGEHRGRIDVKGGGCFQVVGAARVHALELGLRETNTVARIAAAGAHGRYTDDEVRDITEAYEQLLRVRLAHQLEQLEAGVTPDNRIDPERLSHRDALLLRDALKTVAMVQQRLRERYATDYIPA
jgi:CBS domain-containing protein